MPPMSPYPPTPEAAWARIRAVQPANYARTRNAIDGAVSQLSPYITHGFISLLDVHEGVAQNARMALQVKNVARMSPAQRQAVMQRAQDIQAGKVGAG